MASEQFANLAATTLNGAINNSVSTLVVVSATGFPASGNFRIAIGTEILLVTAVSGTTFTVTRGAEGSTAASHASGDAVTHVLTAASYKAGISDFHTSGAYSAIPSAGTVGRLYFPTDGCGQIWRDDGAAWKAWYGGLGPFTPPAGDFSTWVNQGSTGVIDETTGIPYLSASLGGSSENVQCRVKSAPATPWTMTLVFQPNYIFGGFQGHMGLCLRDSGTSKIVTFEHYLAHNDTTDYLSAASINYWTNATTFSSTFANEKRPQRTPIIMLRVSNDGTTLLFQSSDDFRNWITYRSSLIGDFLATINQVGFFIDLFQPSNGSTKVPGGMNVLHAVVG